jgi:hypothetical protein
MGVHDDHRDALQEAQLQHHQMQQMQQSQQQIHQMQQMQVQQMQAHMQQMAAPLVLEAEMDEAEMLATRPTACLHGHKWEYTVQWGWVQRRIEWPSVSRPMSDGSPVCVRAMG